MEPGGSSGSAPWSRPSSPSSGARSTTRPRRRPRRGRRAPRRAPVARFRFRGAPRRRRAGRGRSSRAPRRRARAPSPRPLSPRPHPRRWRATSSCPARRPRPRAHRGRRATRRPTRLRPPRRRRVDAQPRRSARRGDVDAQQRQSRFEARRAAPRDALPRVVLARRDGLRLPKLGPRARETRGVLVAIGEIEHRSDAARETKALLELRIGAREVAAIDHVLAGAEQTLGGGDVVRVRAPFDRDHERDAETHAPATTSPRLSIPRAGAASRGAQTLAQTLRIATAAAASSTRNVNDSVM